MLNEKEIHEAINAADDALLALRQAEKCLSGAGNWGILDMLGGGFLTSLLKHGKISQARQALEEARVRLRRFGDELDDLGHAADFDLEIGDFLQFADYFFDDIFSDLMIQSKVRKGRAQVREAVFRVEDIRARLWSMLN